MATREQMSIACGINGDHARCQANGYHGRPGEPCMCSCHAQHAETAELAAHLADEGDIATTRMWWVVDERNWKVIRAQGEPWPEVAQRFWRFPLTGQRPALSGAEGSTVFETETAALRELETLLENEMGRLKQILESTYNRAYEIEEAELAASEEA